MARSAWRVILMALAMVLGTALVAACGGDDDDDDNDDNDTGDDDNDAGDDDAADDDDAGDDTADDDDDTGGFADNFDDYDVGLAPPAPWEVAVSVGSTILVVDAKDGAGRWVEIQHPGSPTASFLGYTHDAVLADVVTFGFDMAFTGENAALRYYLGHTEETECHVDVIVEWVPDSSPDGHLEAYGTEAATECAAWTGDAWHAVGIVADTAAQTFDVLLDDAATDCAGLPFAAPGFDCLAFKTSLDGTTHAELDNVVLSGTPTDQ
jgi:hypothetical protein